jgi:hypothetical protein
MTSSKDFLHFICDSAKARMRSLRAPGRTRLSKAVSLNWTSESESTAKLAVAVC